MAFIEINFMSEALMRTVTVNVILPADKLMPPEKYFHCPIKRKIHLLADFLWGATEL